MKSRPVEADGFNRAPAHRTEANRLTFALEALRLWLSGQLLIVDVHGPSMEPTLKQGDHLLCARGGVRRASAVIVRDTGQHGERRYQIKRLVALAGEQRGGLVIPTGHCWIEGDNNSESGDSRFFGSIPLTQVIAVGIGRIRAGRASRQLEPDIEPR